MSGPPFVRVVPNEIGRYGFAGATFVAHIRFRCAGPDATLVDGMWWWKVSLAQLAAELHVSKDVAQRTLKRLGDAIAAKQLGEPWDQTRAYRVVADEAALTAQNAESHRFDQPERDLAPTPTRFRTDPDAESRAVPLSQEGKEVYEAAATARECEAESSDAPSAAANAAPANTAALDADAFWAEPVAEVIDAELVDTADTGRRLVADLIAVYPRAVADRLRREVDKLRADGFADDVIADGLGKWDDRADAKPGLLPHLVADVVKERRAALAATHASKITGWLSSTDAAPQAAPRPAQPPEPKWSCPWCHDTGLVLLNDGQPGSTPYACDHANGRRPATSDEIAEYERRRELA